MVAYSSIRLGVSLVAWSFKGLNGLCFIWEGGGVGDGLNKKKSLMVENSWPSSDRLGLISWTNLDVVLSDKIYYVNFQKRAFLLFLLGFSF